MTRPEPEIPAMRRASHRHVPILLLGALLLLTLIQPRPAHAIFMDTDTADTVINTNFCTPTGAVTDTELFVVSCPKDALYNTAGASGDASFLSLGLFSRIICQYEQALSDTFANMFCMMQSYLRAPFMALSMLYVAGMAMLFMFGILPMTGGQFMLSFLKMALVWTFAMNAEAAIGIMYAGLMGGLSLLINAVLGAWGDYFCQAPTPSTPTLWQSLTDDAGWGWQHSEFTNSSSAAMTAYADCMSAGGTVGSATEYETVDLLHNLDQAFSNIFDSQDPNDPTVEGQNSMGVLLATMMMPGGSVLGGLLIADVTMALMLFARSVLGYVLAITGIVFLVTLFPIFGAFALFKRTHYIFESWLKYLISFILQVPIIMAFLMISQRFIADPVEFLQQLKQRIILLDAWFTLGPLSIPKISPAFCRFHKKPDLDIITLQEYEAAIISGTSYPILDRAGNSIACVAGPTCSVPLGANESCCEVILSDCASDRYNDISVLLPKDVLTEGGVVVKELFFQFISLLLLAYMLNQALRVVPDIAKQLSGVKYAGKLGGITPADTANVESNTFHITGSNAVGSAISAATTEFKSAGGPVWTRYVAGARAGIRGFREGAGNRQGLSGELIEEAAHLGSTPEAYAQSNSPQASVYGTASRWINTLRGR